MVLPCPASGQAYLLVPHLYRFIGIKGRVADQTLVHDHSERPPITVLHSIIAVTQHSIAQHSRYTAQHSMASHSVAEHSTTINTYTQRERESIWVRPPQHRTLTFRIGMGYCTSEPLHHIPLPPSQPLRGTALYLAVALLHEHFRGDVVGGPYCAVHKVPVPGSCEREWERESEWGRESEGERETATSHTETEPLHNLPMMRLGLHAGSCTLVLCRDTSCPRPSPRFSLLLTVLIDTNQVHTHATRFVHLLT